MRRLKRFASVLVLLSMLVPMRQAYAILPLIAGGEIVAAGVSSGEGAALLAALLNAPVGGTAAVATVGGMSEGTALATLVGGSLMGLAFWNLDHSDGVGVPTTAGQALPGPPAAGTASASGGGGAGLSVNGTCYAVATPYAACVAAGYLGYSQVGAYCYQATGTDQPNVYGCTMPATCPSGYALSGAQCVLTSARTAVPDHRCDVQRNGASYSYYSDDADCSSVSSAGTLKGSLSGSEWGLSGKNAAGQPVAVKVQTLADGSTVTISAQGTDAGGQTTVKQTTINVGPSGAVLSAGQTTTNGTVQVSPTGGTGTASSTGTAPQQQQQTENCGIPGKPPCDVRVVEAGTTTDATLSAQHSGMDDAGVARRDAVTNAGNRTSLPFVWSPQLPEGQCEDVYFNVHGMSTTVTWCQYLPMLRALIAWGWGLGTLIYIWRRLTEANA